MSKITDAVEKLAKPVAEAAGCSLWDVEYVKEAGTYYLRVFIDKDGGVGINDCETVSRALDPILDREDPIPDSYVFEVGSPGLERALKRPEHFEHCMGEEVVVKLYSPKDGRREYAGTLCGYDEGTVSITAAEGQLSFDKKEYAGVRLRIEF